MGRVENSFSTVGFGVGVTVVGEVPRAEGEVGGAKHSTLHFILLASEFVVVSEASSLGS